MSLLSVFDIAGSALTAQSQRMNISASNMANADSAVGPDGEPYRARQVIFQVKAPEGAAPGHAVAGVRVAGIVEDTAPMKRIFQPHHPMADDEGFVNMPNVDPIAETVNMISASRSYQANVEVINTAKALMQKTLTIGQ